MDVHEFRVRVSKPVDAIVPIPGYDSSWVEHQRRWATRCERARSKAKGFGPMQVHLRLGPALAEVTGNPRLPISLPDGASVEELFARLSTTKQGQANWLESTVAVIDGDTVGKERVLAPDDDVSLVFPLDPRPLF